MKNINVNFNEAVGAMKPMHAGCNTPRYPQHNCADGSYLYVNAGIPYVRMHDTHRVPSAEIDISAIFPDMSKDASDPANYNFPTSDAYIREIYKNDIPVRYRLGQTIEHHDIKLNIFPPKDPQKWADVCVGIYRHFNEGWANGMKLGIKHWEIWEEPDSHNELWAGTEEEFFELYDKASKTLKAYAPDAYVGGCAWASIYNPFVEHFLQFVKDNNCPLDFLSYDIYTNHPEDIKKSADTARMLLDKYGFTDTFTYIAEWNNMGFMDGQPFWNVDPDIATQKEENRFSQKGMAFIAASMAMMQNSCLESAAFYVLTPRQPGWSVMNGHATPHKNYYAFPAFNALYQLGTQVKVEADTEYTLAAKNGSGEYAMYVSNFGDEEETFAIDMKLEKKAYRAEYYLADDKKNLEFAGAASFTGDFACEYILAKDSILLIKIKEA